MHPGKLDWNKKHPRQQVLGYIGVATDGAANRTKDRDHRLKTSDGSPPDYTVIGINMSEDQAIGLEAILIHFAFRKWGTAKWLNNKVEPAASALRNEDAKENENAQLTAGASVLDRWYRTSRRGAR